MLFDVDGVLTDGKLWYGPAGEALKAFGALDGHGIKLLMQSGVAVALLSGRSSQAVALRALELGIPQGETGFMGDELVDLPVLRRCGFACAPREAHELVRNQVQYVAKAPAGAGAAREICDLVMRAQGTLDAALARYLA